MVRSYTAEFNRAYGDNIRIARRRLERCGLEAEIIAAHKTSLIIIRPPDVSWEDFEDAIRFALDPDRGSVMITSQVSGRAWVCSMRGNQPGVFQEIGYGRVAA
jgi:hypothetical protein